MKIGSDIPDRIQKNFRNLNSSKSSNLSRKIQGTNQNLNQTLGSTINTNRSIANALALTRISQSIIQKAIIISTRLKNLATAAITTGKIDTEEVDLAVNQINSSISAHENEIPTPFTTITTTNQSTRPIPEIRTDIENLREEAVKIQNNEKPDIETIDAITENLIGKSKQLGDITGMIFKEAAPAGLTRNNFSNVDDLAISTAGMINNSGTEALIAQGNIIPDTLEKVL